MGIAEALLIGYRNDMDSELNQTYTNAGVVHVIAISGLHLGLIFTSMWWLLSRLRVLKNKILIRVMFSIHKWIIHPISIRINKPKFI